MGSSHSVNAALGKWIRNVDSALLQFSAKAVGSGILEGAEEGIQTYISDWLKSEITKENFHTKPADALYSSLLGFITRTVLDAPDVAADVFLQRDAGEVISPEIQAVEENMTGLGDVRYSDRKKTGEYGGFREVLAKQGLDKLSEKLGSQFPLSAKFDETTRNDSTPLVIEEVIANSIKKNQSESSYKVGRKSFIANYGTKTSIHITQMDIDAELYANVANESISKASCMDTDSTIYTGM